jgi:drug/metabolite transporter (DMT)-like permease
MRDLIGVAGLAGIGSVGGTFLTSLCAQLPAAQIFTVQGVSGIVTAALISVLAFGEPCTKAWYGTVGAGVLGVTLANLNQLVK